jgi:kumamolisin
MKHVVTFHAYKVWTFVILASIVVIMSACLGNSQSTAQSTITPTVPVILYSPIALGLPKDVITNEKNVGPIPDTTPMTVTLFFKLNTTQQQQLQKALKAGSQHAIGLDPKIVRNIQTFFGISKVSLQVDKEQTYGAFSAPAKTVAKLFKTSFAWFTYKKQRFYAPIGQPQLPSVMVPYITSVQGLDSYQQPIQTGVVVEKKLRANPHADCSPSQGVIPQQVAKAYGFDQFINNNFAGQNMTVVLAEIDTFNSADIQNYAACVNYTGNIQTVNVDTPPTQVAGESTLDLEMIMSLAPKINIVDYQTGSGTKGLLDEITQISQLNTSPGSVVSISIGGPEEGMSRAFLDAFNQRLTVIDSHHESVFIASGDCAAFTDQVFGSKSVSFPASSPFAISVGGTQLQTDTQGDRANEITWSDPSPNTSSCQNAWGSGGGTSNYFPQPSYQQVSGSNAGALSSSLGFRNVPDVSAIADNLPVYVNGQWELVGGTSAATPIWATGMALIDQALIAKKGLYYYGPGLLYYAGQIQAGNSQGPFFDIVQGTNFAYNAGPGWDYTSGFGTPNLVSLYQVLLAVK